LTAGGVAGTDGAAVGAVVVVERPADAVGEPTAAVEAAAGTGFPDPMVPARATPPATAARARTTTAAAHTRRRRVLVFVDGASS